MVAKIEPHDFYQFRAIVDYILTLSVSEEVQSLKISHVTNSSAQSSHERLVLETLVADAREWEIRGKYERMPQLVRTKPALIEIYIDNGFKYSDACRGHWNDKVVRRISEASTKSSPACRRHFQICFFEWKYFNFEQKFSGMSGWGSVWDKSTSVDAMAWCRQAAIYYLSWCVLRYVISHGVTWPHQHFVTGIMGKTKRYNPMSWYYDSAWSSQVRSWRPASNEQLTHWGRDEMDAITQTTFSSALFWKKIFEFRLKFHWSLFLRVE